MEDFLAKNLLLHKTLVDLNPKREEQQIQIFLYELTLPDDKPKSRTTVYVLRDIFLQQSINDQAEQYIIRLDSTGLVQLSYLLYYILQYVKHLAHCSLINRVHIFSDKTLYPKMIQCQAIVVMMMMISLHRFSFFHEVFFGGLP